MYGKERNGYGEVFIEEGVWDIYKFFKCFFGIKQYRGKGEVKGKLFLKCLFLFIEAGGDRFEVINGEFCKNKFFWFMYMLRMYILCKIGF